MDRIILTITSELFDDNPHQEVSVRPNITIRSLVDEILREFSLLEGNYSMTQAGTGKVLPLDQTLEQVGLQTGAELVFGRERRRLSQQIVMRGGQYFQTLESPVRAFLREEPTGTIFDIEWQPALIGRPDAHDPSSAALLAVDLSEMAEARTVSRQHARITERNGQYFIEGIADRNPTFVNDRELVIGEKRALQSGDKICVGKILLRFQTERS
jgi:hypothetical protein